MIAGSKLGGIICAEWPGWLLKTSAFNDTMNLQILLAFHQQSYYGSVYYILAYYKSAAKRNAWL